MQLRNRTTQTLTPGNLPPVEVWENGIPNGRLINMPPAVQPGDAIYVTDTQAALFQDNSCWSIEPDPDGFVPPTKGN